MTIVVVNNMARSHVLTVESVCAGERTFGSMILTVSVWMIISVSCLKVTRSLHFVSHWTILTVSAFSWMNTMTESLSMSVSTFSRAAVRPSYFWLVS